MTLTFEPILPHVPGIRLWGAVKRDRSFVIAQDMICADGPDQHGDVYLNRFSASVRMFGAPTRFLGFYDTFAEAALAAEAGEAA